jgi:Nucleotidyl transferase AbiEii toxin, Type IV TA system
MWPRRTAKMVSKASPEFLAPQLQAAWHVEHILRSAKRGFCLIGGMALFRWSEPRLTRDVDLTVLCPFGDEPETIDWLLSRIEPRLTDAREYALHNRVLLLRYGAIDVDISLGAIDFEQRAVLRASQHLYAPGINLTTCSAEDLIVFKAFASRGQDWVDVESIIRRQGDQLAKLRKKYS